MVDENPNDIFVQEEPVIPPKPDVKAPYAGVKDMLAQTTNWLALKTEFFLGKWKSVNEFMAEKDLEITRATNLVTKHWAEEKRIIIKRVTDRLMETIVSDLHSDRIKAMRDAHVKEAKALIEKSSLALARINPEDISASEARKMLATGTLIWREAEGVSENPKDSKGGGSNLTQVNVGVKTNLDQVLDELDYAGLIKLLAEIRREKSRRAGETGVVEDKTGTDSNGTG